MRLYNLLNEATGIDRRLASVVGHDAIMRRLNSDSSSKEFPDAESFVEYLRTEIAPVANSAYTEWLLRRYLNGGIRYFEDLDGARVSLATFEKNKQKLKIRDINQFKSLPELDKYLHENRMTTISKNDLKDYAEATTEVIYDGPRGKILWPRTMGASCYYGRGSNWCISAETSENYFNEYTHDNGYDIVMIFPKDKTMWAIVFENGEPKEAFDQFDESVSWRKIFEDYPWIEEYLWFDNVPARTTKDDQIVKLSPHDLVHLVSIGKIDGDDLAKHSDELTPHQLRALVEYKGEFIKFIKNPPEWLQMIAIKNDAMNIKFIDSPTEKVKLAAVEKNGYAIQYIEDQSEELKWAAVKQDGYVIQYISNPSEELKWAAVKQDGYVIQYISNPSEEMKWAAIKENGSAIQYISNPSEEMKWAAIKENGSAIQYIDNPSEEMKWDVIERNGQAIAYINNPSEELKLAAVKNDGWAIQYIDNPSEEVQLAAIKQNWHTISVIKNPTEKVQMIVAKQSKDAIRYIKNPSEKAKLAAVKHNWYSIYYIKNPSEKVKLATVKQNEKAIMYISNPSEKVQLAAVKQNWRAIEYIRNPSEEVQLAAVKQNGYAIQYIKHPSKKVVQAARENGYKGRFIGMT